MSDFTINIDSKLDLSQAKDKIDTFIKDYNGKIINLEIKLDPKSANSSNLGKQLQSQLNSSVKNVHFTGDTFYKEYFKQAKKDVAEAKRVAIDFEKSITESSTIGINKSAIKAVNAKKADELRAQKEHLAQQKQQQKELDAIENARVKSIEKASKREAQINQQQSSAINKALTDKYKQEQKDINAIENARIKSIESANKREAQIVQQQNDAINKALVERYKQVSNLNTSLNNGKYDAKSSSMKSQLSAYSNQDTELLRTARQQVELYDKTIVNLKRHFDTNDTFKMNDEDVVKSFNNMSNAAEKFGNTMTQIRNTGSKDLGLGVAERSANSVKTYYTENSKALKKYGAELRDLEQRYRSISTIAEKANLDNEFKNLKASISAKGLTGRSFLDEIGRSFKQIGIFAGTYGIIQKIPEYLIKMTQETIKVDDAMTQMMMATDISNEKAKDLMNTYTKMGKELKATSVDVATSATEWMKQGKAIEEANQLAKDSIILSKIGDLSTQESTSTITAAMKSYNLDETGVQNFIDQISAIDMASATDVGGLANAFNEVAANAKQAGVETQKLLAYAAAIGETTQEGMASVGNSLNAIFSRMGNIKLSRLKDYETGEDLSNVEMVLKGVGIQLRDSVDQFRDFDDVLDDTAKRWSSFSSVQQRAVAQAFAGTNHMNDFMVLMQQWENVQKYIQTADNASGESLKKYEAYQQSLSGRIEGFKNQFQELSTTIANDNAISFLIDSGTTLLNILTQIEKYAGIISLIFGGTAVVKAVKNFDKSNDFVLYGCESIVA